jgi:DNA replication and repair protein RecF
LYLKQIIAKNFRNYSTLNISFKKEKKINLIHSPNGMGKSNLLEIIYYLSYLRSFRNVLDKELILKGQDNFYIEGTYKDNYLTNTIKINYKKTKDIVFNDKKIKKYSEIFGKLLTVLFCNEDIFIINGSPSIKRKFFDIFISAIDINYLYILKDYQNVIKQKNYILKSNNTSNLLSVYNRQIAKLILQIQNKRQILIDEINKQFDESYQKIGLFKEKVKIIYCPSIKNKDLNEENILNFLEENSKEELKNLCSIFGPHRDNYLFLIRGIPFAKYASFGQTRLAALVLKFIQAEIYREKLKVNPILLLDDVILELDRQKQSKFINELVNYSQIFLTVTDKDYVELFNKKDEINTIEIYYGQTR